MKLITSLDELHKAHLLPSAAALGTFDGVHLGHQEVIGTTRTYARQHNLQLMVFTFSTHPLASLKPELEPPRLLDNATKVKLMVELGVDILVNIPFTRELAAMSADAFLEMLVRCGVRAVGIGDNFSFGAGGKGNVRLLKTEHTRFGLTILSRPLLKKDGLVVSSTNIRKAIAAGRVELAAAMLGRPYEIRGQVVPGDQRGRLLGFPTANLRLLGQHFAIPAFGVYAGRVLVDAAWYGAMVNVGDNPTFANQETRLEAHLFHYHDNLYRKELRVQLLMRLRGEQKFSSLEKLQEQLKEDARMAQGLLLAQEGEGNREKK
ncbi:riboflavin biosynthesis protein RibF [Acidaminococcus massiliensis]|uniref:riboflavin biosynthesis protein RibF n=1 Tax=Acidaminococcus massiliensis TaxID=1852375 RepID=UPI0026DCD91E|nr:riboflavin biosynthesis protein RibF [Acidaminococcus massiliensis]